MRFRTIEHGVHHGVAVTLVGDHADLVEDFDEAIDAAAAEVPAEEVISEAL